jgi:hypothetical protein
VSAAEEDWGVVVPLRRPAPERGSSELGPISPELVLVDPELARAARALLPDFPRAVPVRTPAAAESVTQSVFVERLRSGIEPVVEETAAPRRRGIGLLTGILCVGAAAALLTFLVRPESKPEPQQAALAEPPATVAATTPSSAPGGTPAPEPEQPTPAQTTPAQTTPTQTTPTQTTPTQTTPAQTVPQAAPPPTEPKVTTPPAVAAPPGQTFVWVAAAEAGAYEFQLFRGNERVFRARVTEPRLDLPGRWRHADKAESLTPGTYRWYVWPVSARTKRQAAVAIVQARLVIEEQPQ